MERTTNNTTNPNRFSAEEIRGMPEILVAVYSPRRRRSAAAHEDVELLAQLVPRDQHLRRGSKNLLSEIHTELVSPSSALRETADLPRSHSTARACVWLLRQSKRLIDSAPFAGTVMKTSGSKTLR